MASAFRLRMALLGLGAAVGCSAPLSPSEVNLIARGDYEEAGHFAVFLAPSADEFCVPSANFVVELDGVSPDDSRPMSVAAQKPAFLEPDPGDPGISCAPFSSHWWGVEEKGTYELQVSGEGWTERLTLGDSEVCPFASCSVDLGPADVQ